MTTVVPPPAAPDVRSHVPFRQLDLIWSSEPAATIVRLRGDVDANALHETDAIAVVAEHAPQLVLDLESVYFVDVAGLDLLEGLASRPKVHVRELSAPIRRVLHRTRGVTEEWPTLRRAADA